MSDFGKILNALEALDGYAVQAGCGSTVTDGWSEISSAAELQLDDVGKDFPCAWWTEDANRQCFDEKGRLVARLHVHWRGDRKVIARALKSTGLRIEVPRDESGTFVVEPAKAAKRAGKWISMRAADLRVGDVLQAPGGLGTVTR